MNKLLIFLFLSVFFHSVFSLPSFSQIGGNSTFNFLKIPVSARSAALGGNMIAANDSDFTLVSDNPSLLNQAMHNNFSLSYINYLADINLGYAGYARNYKTIGMIAAGIQYLNYGKFTQTDIYDQKLGEFSASDYSLNLSFSRKLHPRFISGGTIKGIYSSLYENKSYGIAADLAATYHSKNNSLIAALVFKNMGSQITNYTKDIREPMPLEVTMGISKKIKHAPVRLLYYMKNLQKWNLAGPSFLNSAYYINLKDELKKPTLLGYNLAMHSVVGVELIPIKGFSIRLGYDPKKRREMELVDRSGLIGFSFGAGIRILRMNLNYARGSYHFAGASNHLSLSMNISEFAAKKSNASEEQTKPE